MRVVASVLFIVGMASSVPAQVLQLPTMRSFGYSGSVLVPDRGAASLGGIGRGGSSSQQAGWLGPVPRGAAAGAGFNGASLHPHVIDLRAWDEGVLGTDPQTYARRRRETQQSRGEEAVRLTRTERAKQYVRTAREAAKQGKFRVAEMYYSMAIRRLPKELASYASAERARMLQAAESTTATQSPGDELD